MVRFFLFRETLNHDEQVEEQNDELELVTPAPVEQEEVEEQPVQAQNGEKMTKQEWYALPTYIRDQVKPRKPMPEFKEQVKF